MRMSEHIKLRQDGAVLEIIFARPEKKNALSNAMYRAVTEALERAHNDQAIRVVLFGAEGVPGLAVGVGTTMLLHCDLVYVAETATLTTPFVNLALVPEAGSSMLLPGRIGHARAFAMFALGESLSGPEAFTLGLANKVLPRDEVLPAARAAARKLAAQPLGAVVATKKLMRERERILARMAEE